MNMLFCKIPWMNYYKGNFDGNDMPRNGGEYIDRNGIGGDVENFMPIHIGTELHREFYCFGYVETDSIHIENICPTNNDTMLNEILVVFCARSERNNETGSCVVGWYKNATVYRNRMNIDIIETPVGKYSRPYYIIAKRDDCVLLPTGIRRKPEWRIRYDNGNEIRYGFGEHHLWYANGSENEKALARRIEDQILDYGGENWINKYHIQ